MNYDFLVIAIVAFFVSLLYPVVKKLIISRKEKRKEEPSKFWAISYYAQGPKKTELIGISIVEAPNLEMAEMKCAIEVSMKNKGTVVKSSVGAQIGTTTKRVLPVDPSWEDLKEKV